MWSRAPEGSNMDRWPSHRSVPLREGQNKEKVCVASVSLLEDLEVYIPLVDERTLKENSVLTR